MSGHSTRRLPDHLGQAAWNALLGPQPAAHPLEGARTADFVVVGAGFAGLSAARRLTQLQAGARIAVLEAGRLAEGAAGRNSGFMIDLPHDLASDDYAGAGDDRLMIGSTAGPSASPVRPSRNTASTPTTSIRPVR